jgi:ribonuclease T2
MRKGVLAILSTTMAAALAMAAAAQDRADDFDYYVLALSWSPSWCEAEGGPRDAQCDPDADRGFVVHGLWPQYETGWPEWCRTAERNPSRSETAAMADVMGSGGLAWHQWKKHGRCTGLSSRDYFRLTREAFARVTRPDALRRLDEPVRIDPDVIEAAFLKANPGAEADGVTVTCRDGRLREVRICLDRSLAFRTCGRDTRRDCSADLVRLPPIP